MVDNNRRENINQLVEAVLHSPALRNCIQTCLNDSNSVNPHTERTSSRIGNSSTFGTSTSSHQQSAVEEVRRLFPSIRSSRSSPSCSSMSSQSSRNVKRRRGCFQTDKPFTKDIILLISPQQTRTLTGKAKADAYNAGFGFTAVQFEKQWSQIEIRNKIEEIFQDKLHAEFEFLVPIGGYLVKPKIKEEELDGDRLSRIYKNKVIYIRPLVAIEFTHEDDSHTVVDGYQTDEVINVTKNNDREQNVSLLFEPNSLLEILTELSKQLNEEVVSQFNIYREDIFNCCIRAMRRKSFAPCNKISVVFTDIENNPEGAVDVGGPKREMFRLAFQYLNNSRLFSGPSNKKFIALNKDALDKNHYYETGKLMAMAIVHCGFGPRFFSEVFYTLLVEGSNEIELNLEDLTDPDIRNEVQLAIDAPDLNTLRKIIYEGTFILLAGWEVFNDFTKKDMMIKDVMRFYIVDRCLTAIQQFRDGLETLQVYKYMKQNPEYFIELMCNTNEGILTLSKFNDVFTIIYSEPGSNRRNTESRIIAFWNDYLIECDENGEDGDVCSLEELLIFATAFNVVPCSGFSVRPTIKFLHDSSIFPRGNTCGLELYLPTVHTQYDVFKYNITFGVKNGMTFGYA